MQPRSALALLVLLPAVAFSQSRSGNRLTVSGKIQAALDKAVYGDVVVVPAGTYRECIVMRNSGVTLEGAGRDQTHIECDGLALKVQSANDLTIRGITFVKVGNFYKNSAVWFDGGSGTFIHNRVIIDSTMSLAGFEVSMTGGAWVIEENEILRAVQSGLYVHGYGSARVVKNVIKNSGSAGIYFEELGSGTIEGNTIDTTGAAGIFVDNSPARVAKNDVRRAKYAGIEVKGKGMTGTVEQNWIQDNVESGIYANTESAPRIVRNIIWKNGLHGVVARNSRPEVEENTIVACKSIGLVAYARATMNARRNIVVGCDKGISLSPPPGESTGTIYHTDNVFFRQKWGNFQQITKDPSELEVDPDFVDEANGDFHLRSTSPLLGRKMAYGAYGGTAGAAAVVTRTTPPPDLSATATYDDASGNGDRVLDAGERGLMVVRIRNGGKGPALDVKAVVSLKAPNRDIVVGPPRTVGKMEAGDSQIVEIPMSGTEDLMTGDATFSVEVTEKDGFDAEPVVLRLATRSRAQPALRVARYSISDQDGVRSSGNGNGRIEKAEQIEVKATIANVGKGAAEEVKAALVSSHDDVAILTAPLDLGTMPPAAQKQASFAFSVKRRYSGPATLPLSLQITEKRGRANHTEPLELTLDSSAPQGKVLDLTAAVSMGDSGEPVAVAKPVFEGAEKGTSGGQQGGGGVQGLEVAPPGKRKPIVPGKPTIVILDLTTKSKEFDPEVLSALSDRVKGTIAQSDFFVITSRERMDEILKEKKFQQSELCDQTKCYAEMGGALGAQYMAVGKVTKIKKTYTLNLQLVDVDKVVNVNVTNKDCKGCEEDDLLALTDAATWDLISAKQ